MRKAEDKSELSTSLKSMITSAKVNYLIKLGLSFKCIQKVNFFNTRKFRNFQKILLNKAKCNPLFYQRKSTLYSKIIG